MKTDRDTPTADNNTKNTTDDNITNTIEEIIPDDSTSTGEAEQVVIDPDNQYACFNCGYKMVKIKACMLRCINCGATKDCSETVIW